MKHPEKWRETANPFELPYKRFELKRVLGYPHARNDVFHVEGKYLGKNVEAYIKVARQEDSDIKNEVEVISKINCPLAPQILDCDEKCENFVVQTAMGGERLSYILSQDYNENSLDYMFEYGRTLAKLHACKGEFQVVKDRKFFHIPSTTFFEENGLEYVYDFLVINKPKTVNECFCHGDFHYANVLFENKMVSAILDFELAGLGNREFDIAWAIIRRPGQTFLKSEKEVEEFLNGYTSLEKCNADFVKYYMVLIYTYFYEIGIKNSEYTSYVKSVFYDVCKA